MTTTPETRITPAMVNAAWSKGKDLRMSGLPTDFRQVLEAAMAAAAPAAPAPPETRANSWSPIKKAIWAVLMDENLNDGHYISAHPLADKLVDAVLAAAPAAPAPEPVARDGWGLVHSGGKRWRIVGPDGRWTMQPEGEITAQEAEAICRSILYTTPPAPVAASAVDAIRFIEMRRDDYVREHGTYDPETGQTEFPGNGDEYVGELEEIIDGLKALTPAPVAASAVDGLRAAADYTLNALIGSAVSAGGVDDRATILEDQRRLRVALAASAVGALRPFAAAVINDNGDVTISTGHITRADYIAADKALRSALEGAPSSPNPVADNPAGDPVVNAPRVRELEWVNEPPCQIARVPSMGIHYAIEVFFDGEFFDHVSLTGALSGEFYTVLDAMKAAQSDYERRVRACLEPGQGWRDISSAGPLDRLIVAGWQPPHGSTVGYWWWAEDATDEHGVPMGHPDALKWLPAPDTSALPPQPTAEGSL